jgi:hypothetical protein
VIEAKETPKAPLSAEKQEEEIPFVGELNELLKKKKEVLELQAKALEIDTTGMKKTDIIQAIMEHYIGRKAKKPEVQKLLDFTLDFDSISGDNTNVEMRKLELQAEERKHQREMEYRRLEIEREREREEKKLQIEREREEKKLQIEREEKKLQMEREDRDKERERDMIREERKLEAEKIERQIAKEREDKQIERELQLKK